MQDTSWTELYISDSEELRAADRASAWFPLHRSYFLIGFVRRFRVHDFSSPWAAISVRFPPAVLATRSALSATELSLGLIGDCVRRQILADQEDFFTLFRHTLRPNPLKLTGL